MFPGPRSAVVTPDDTRAYVSLWYDHGISVIDAEALQEIDLDPSTTAIDHINLPDDAAPFWLAVDPSGQFLYASDEFSGSIYVIDIRPTDIDYNRLVYTINVPTATYGLRGLAISSDGNRLYVAAPANWEANEVDDVPATDGTIDVIDVSLLAVSLGMARTGLVGGGMPPLQIRQLQAGADPYAVTAATDPNLVAATNFLDDPQGLESLVTGEPPLTSSIHLDTSKPYLEVNNAVGVAITADGKYAFVTGYDTYLRSDPAHDPNYDPEQPAGGHIAIIADPFGNPQVVAVTRPTPDSFPDNLVLSADGRYLYAAYRGQSSVFVFDVALMLQTIQNSSPDELSSEPIDDINPAIDVQAAYQLDRSDPDNPIFRVTDPVHAPIATGGTPQGLAAESQPLVVTVSGTAGEFIPVNLASLVQVQFGGLPTSFNLDITSFTEGQVALDTRVALLTAGPGGLSAAQALSMATQDDILQSVPPLPGFVGPPPPPAHFVNTGLFYFLADPGLSGPSIARGTFTYTLANGRVREATILITIRSPVTTIDRTLLSQGQRLTLDGEKQSLTPYVPWRPGQYTTHNNSGITIGVGYDVGSLQPGTTTLIREWTAAGIPLAVIKAYEATEGLHTQDALDYLNAHSDQLPPIYEEQERGCSSSPTTGSWGPRDPTEKDAGWGIF